MNRRTNNASGSTSTFTVDNRNQLTGGHTYDGNGNLTYKGSDQLTYDAENQLVDYTIPGSYKTIFAYDGRGRLRQRTEYTSAGGTNWTFSVQITYLYDGRRVIQERNGSTPMVAYTRGYDLAGSLEGAGGIGGLLARTHGYSAGAWSTHHYYHADGNGNVTYLVNSSQGLGCSYRYRPYGELLASSTGTLSASANAYRFSSKEWLATSGLYYYGYRFYQPTLQRWLNRDPLMEEGGINLYTFNSNEPASRFDRFGLSPSLNPQNQAYACEAIEAAASQAARRAADQGLNLSSKLARNLNKAGRGVNAGDRAHYIVAEADKRAKAARKVLEKLKVDIDDAANGVGLPNKLHKGLHTDKYYDRISDLAKGWKDKDQAIEGLRACHALKRKSELSERVTKVSQWRPAREEESLS